MKLFQFLIVLLFFSANAQIESSKRKVNISAQPEKASKKAAIAPKVTGASSVPPLQFESQFLKKKDPLDRQYIDLPTVGLKETKVVIKNPAEIYTDKYNQKLESEGISPELFNRDMFLGEYMVDTKTISIDCRDFGLIDGDEVRIWVNGEMIQRGIYLESNFKSYVLELKDGSNVIEIEALNYGELSPNTGQFSFYDANKRFITNQYWNLGIGYKARVIIRKVDVVLKEQK